MPRWTPTPQGTRACSTPGRAKSSMRRLAPEDAAIAKLWFNVEPGGNFEGRTVLAAPRTAADVADRLGIDRARADRVPRPHQAATARSAGKRERPARDEKVITGWNGLMLRAFADGSRVLDRDDFRDVAVRNAEFVLEHLQRDGRLLRSWKNGDARIGGFLEDYAFFIDGLLALYRATLDSRWLDEALRLADLMWWSLATRMARDFFDTSVQPRDTGGVDRGISTTERRRPAIRWPRTYCCDWGQ